MKYYFTKSFKGSFEQALEKVRSGLKKEGFGVLTEIDVKETLKKKLDVDFRRYQILGACNPPFAHKALQAEANIGLMLPCNVVVQEIDQDRVEISAIDPVASMQAVDNDALNPISEEIRSKLKTVIEAL